MDSNKHIISSETEKLWQFGHQGFSNADPKSKQDSRIYTKPVYVCTFSIVAIHCQIFKLMKLQIFRAQGF